MTWTDYLCNLLIILDYLYDLEPVQEEITDDLQKGSLESELDNVPDPDNLYDLEKSPWQSKWPWQCPDLVFRTYILVPSLSFKRA